MPPIVTGGLVWDWSGGTLQLQTDKLFLDVFSGFNEHPEVRGKDDVVPGLPGRYRRNRVDDRLIIELRGWARGVGGTAVERQQDFRATVTALQASMDPTGSGGTLTVLSPYLGLVSGSQSIVAYPMTMMGAELQNTMSFTRLSLELEAIGNPPRWFTDESS